MTSPTTSEALLLWAAKNTAERKPGLSPSAIGGCRKRAGYIMAKTPPSNPGESVVSAIGSAIHDKVAEALRVACPDDLIEHRIEFAGLEGTCDRYRRADTTCVDTKTTSSRWLEHIRLHGPDDQHRWQVSIYAAGLRKQGHDVTHCELQYLARDTGEEWPYRWVFDPRDVRDALQWVKGVQDVPLEMLPRDYLPDSGFCKNCAFLGDCWPGVVNDTPPLEVLFTDNPDADEWADALWAARLDKKDAVDREARAKGALETLRQDMGDERYVWTGSHMLDYRTNGLYFVSTAGKTPAAGYQEGDS